jgi:hypothetical protein
MIGHFKGYLWHWKKRVIGNVVSLEINAGASIEEETTIERH